METSIKKIIVTGGAGFIGSHLCHTLYRQGHQITCIDNLSSGSITNIQPLMDQPRFTFIEHDVISPIDLEADELYHLASPAAPEHYQKDPIHTIQTSVIGSMNMLELAKKNDASILLTSTSEVYGDPLVHPQTEAYWGNVNPVGIRSCYDEGKRCAETLFFEYHQQHQVDTKIVRLFNTYGPMMNGKDGRVISNFIVKALQQIDIPIYGEGTQTRSFQYIDDCIEALTRTMALGDHLPINIGNPEEYTINDIAHRIIQLTKSKAKIIYKPLPSDDPQQRCPSIVRAFKQLDGWTPKVGLEQGLKHTIAHFQSCM